MWWPHSEPIRRTVIGLPLDRLIREVVRDKKGLGGNRQLQSVLVGATVYMRVDLDDFVENGNANTSREEGMVNPIVENTMISS